MLEKKAPGRPKKDEKYKRSKSFLLRMKPIDFEVISKNYVKAQKKDSSIESLTDFIIKQARQGLREG